MLVECPKCSRRHEVARSDGDATVACPCGEGLKVLAWLSYRRIFSDRGRMACPSCGREYDLSKFRVDTQVACGCGSLILVKSGPAAPKARGRRKTDQSERLHDVELHGLVDTARLIHSATHDLDKLLAMVIRIAGETLDAEGATIALRDKEGGLVFRFVVTEGHAAKLKSLRLAKGEGIVGECVAKRVALIVNSPREDARFSRKADDESGFLTRSILCVPLTVEDACIGALELVNKKSAAGFTRHDLALAEAVADQIAVAIQNALLSQEALKAERLAAIGEAVAGVAHCIKNMLNGLNGGMYLLKSSIKKSGADVPDRSIGMVDRNLELLKGLVMDMLTYAKDRQPEYEERDFNELVQSVVDLMLAKAAERGLALRYMPEAGLGKAEFDGQGVYRCVLNLVGNALDACEGREAAEVEVRTRRADDDAVAVEVADQGCGMDEATRKSLFRAFFSTKGSKGTGLGLSVTQKIIREHGGKIEVDSAVGQGTTFTITLPRRRPAPANVTRKG